jgi:uncharacterized Zn finger protein (UPF0148 family)
MHRRVAANRRTMKETTMLNISCTYCRAPINLSDGDLAQAVHEAGDKRPKTTHVTCPSCRRTNKVPFDRVRQAYRMAGSPPPEEIAPAVEGE